MASRIAGALLIAAAVIATFVASPPAVMRPSREDLLIEAFPQLSRQPPEATWMHVRADTGSSALLIPDPFLRSANKTAEDFAYDAALRGLLASQIDLRVEEERSIETRRGTPSRVSDARKRRDAAEQAAENASRVRNERSPVVGTPGYSGILVQRNTIVMRFRDDVDAETIRAFLMRQRLVVRSGNARIGLLVVELEDAEPERTLDGDATKLRAVIDLLNEQKDVVDVAVQNSLLGPNMVPRPSNAGRKWFGSARDPLVVGHFPEAWNFNQAITSRRSHVNVGVLDEGFVSGVCQQGDCDLDVTLTCTNAFNYHGTEVASIIGATFDDGVGMDGAAPFASIFGCAPDPPPTCDPKVPGDCAVLTQKGKTFDRFINGIPLLLNASQARVINASIGYNWSNFSDLNPLDNADVRTLVAAQGSLVRATMKPYPEIMLVAAAGNDSDRTGNIHQPAVWASPFNWAALGGNIADRSPNVIVVEALSADGITPLNDSNESGSIAAVGELVLTLFNKNMYTTISGTSAAAPMVTSAIAMMWAVNTNLCPNPNTCGDEIKKKLEVGSTPLNAFNALRNSAADPYVDLADLVAPFGRVDMNDFQKFKDGYRQVKNNQFTDDLNFDTKIDANDGMFCRIDLDGNGRVEKEDLEVMIRAWSGGLSADEAAALRAQL